MQPIAGVFAERYGARYICVSFIAAALITSLTPVASKILWLTIVLRFLSGLVIVNKFYPFYTPIFNL